MADAYNKLGGMVALANGAMTGAPAANDYSAFNAAMGYTQAQGKRGPYWTDRAGAVVPVATIDRQYEWWNKEAAPAAAQGANPAMMIDYKSFEDDPAKVTAEITRKQWDDYQSRFVPFENQLMDMTSYNNPGIVNQEIRAAIGEGNPAQTYRTGRGAIFQIPATGRGYVHKALDNAESQQKYQFQRYGMAPTDQQQTAIQSQNSLNRSKTVVDAANRIRRNISDRNMQIASGAVPNAGRSYGLRDPGPVVES